MQNFTLIGATITEVSVTPKNGQKANLVPCILTYGRCHTNVWRVIILLHYIQINSDKMTKKLNVKSFCT